MTSAYLRNIFSNMFGDKIQDYEILEHLGKGGFAHVYRAKCLRTQSFVAIKMIDKALMASAGMIGRVRQEVTIHSRLKHPAILELYTFFEDAHYVYLVLELAHNGELAKHFKLGTRGLSEKAAADIFKQVVSGVLYLHTHNIIHRDLSLNNLLLTKDMIVKIADFGLATQLNGPDEKHVTMCGTPNYISPEVASRELHGLPADVWGLGCMLYTLLVGSPPFHTRHVKTTLNKVINAEYTVPSELSHQAQDLVHKLLCKDPTKRITLKGIMEHQFLNYMNMACSITSKPDMSRDSGFLTTLHSTQHSSKLRSDDKPNSDILANHKVSNLCNILQDHPRPASFNLFAGPSDFDMLSVYSNEQNHQARAKSADINNHYKSNRKQHPNHFSDKQEVSPEHSTVLDHLKNININPHKFAHQQITENKENIPRSCSTNSIGVPPLCADRLPVISHRTRNALLKIETANVVVEFIKKKGKDREERVVEVCRISKDGMKIIIFCVDKRREPTATNTNYDPTPDEVFSYHNLPQKHWKKYLYASRFVDLVKAKTPKITLYSSIAKCQLMENGSDIEMFFYDGEKVTYTACDGFKIIDKSSKTHNTSNPELKYLMDHFEDCSNRLKRIQVALSCIPDECFPLIIGRRPSHALNQVASPAPTNNIDCNTPFNIGSFHRTAASSSQAPSDYHIY